MNDKSNSALISGFKWVILGKLSTQIITWCMTFFVLRLLNPDDYGVVALSAAITLFFGLVAEFGFSSAIVQAKTINRLQLGNMFGWGLIVNILMMFIVITLAPYVTKIYSDDRLPSIIQLASVQFLFSAFSLIPDAKMKREMQFKFMAKLEFSLGIFAGVSTFLMAYAGFQYWALVISPILAAFARMLILNAVAKEWIKPNFSFVQMRDLFKFGGFKLASRIAGHFLSQVDILIAGAYLSKDALGIYSVSIQLAQMPLSKMMMVVNQVAYPEMSRMNREEGFQKSSLLFGMRLISAVLFPVLWGLAAVSPYVVHLLMGEKWGAAVIPLQLVCLALPFRAISVLLTTAVSAFGRADIELANTISGCLIFPVLFLIGVQYGVVGLAYAWLVGTPTYVMINILRSKKVLQISLIEVASCLAVPMLCAGAMYGILVLLLMTNRFQQDNAYHLTFSIVLGSMLYSGLLGMFDRQILKSLVNFIKAR